MLEKLKLVEARYLEMAERAAQPDFYNDPKAASQLLKEQRQLEPIITAYRSYMKTTQEQDDLRAMLSEGLDPEMKALCQEEFSANKKKLEELEQELKCSCCRATRTTTRASSWRSAAASAARKARCSPTACTGCTRCTPSPSAGRSRC